VQRFLTVSIDCREVRPGVAKEYLKDELSQGWHVASMCATGATGEGGAAMVWLAVVLEKPDPMALNTGFASEFPLMPQIEFPQSKEGVPVEPSEVPVGPDTYLEIGSRVLSFSQGRWWRAEVVGLEPDGKVKIHYPGWDAKWDVVLPRDELQVDLHSCDE
jgi:hypothetical protein